VKSIRDYVHVAYLLREVPIALEERRP